MSWEEFAAPVAGSVINGISNAYANSQNRAIMREQNQFNLDMWNRNNAYNSPSQQVQRLKDANLNPSLMYGSQAGLSASTAPQSSGQAKMNPIDVTNLAIATQQAKLLKAQTDNTEVHTDKLKSETEGQDISNKYSPQQFQANIDSLNKGIDEMTSRIGLNNLNIDFLDKTFKQRVDSIEFDNRLKGSQIRLNSEQVDLFKQQISTLASQTILNRALSDKANMDSKKVKRELLELEDTYDERKGILVQEKNLKTLQVAMDIMKNDLFSYEMKPLKNKAIREARKTQIGSLGADINSAVEDVFGLISLILGAIRK